RIGGVGNAKITLQCSLLVATGGAGVEFAEEVGEGLHALVDSLVAGLPTSLTSSSPYSVSKACASSPCSHSQRTSTGTLPCVTRICSAPGPSIALSRPGQSAWSDMTKPRSTPRRLRRPRTCIQPLANASDASAPNRFIQGVP